MAKVYQIPHYRIHRTDAWKRAMGHRNSLDRDSVTAVQCITEGESAMQRPRLSTPLAWFLICTVEVIGLAAIVYAVR